MSEWGISSVCNTAPSQSVPAVRALERDGQCFRNDVRQSAVPYAYLQQTVSACRSISSRMMDNKLVIRDISCIRKLYVVSLNRFRNYWGNGGLEYV